MKEKEKPNTLLKTFLYLSLPGFGILFFYLFSQLSLNGISANESTQKAVTIGYVLLGFVLFYRITCVVVLDYIIGSLKNKALPRIVKNLLGIGLATLAILITINLFFTNAFAHILTLSSVIGVVIGLALRPIILDIFSGISTNLDAGFQIGDWIEVHESADKDGYCGFVEEINWRTTLIRTKTGNYLICPNSMISTAQITNYSRPNRFSRFQVTFKLPAQIDSKRARRLITTAVNATLNSELGPCPEMKIDVYVSDLREAAVYYLVRYWIDRSIHSYRGSRHRVLQSILHHLNMAGIPLAEDIIYNLNADVQANTGKSLSTTEIISRIDLFEGIDKTAIVKLASTVETFHFEAGELIVIEGNIDADMYMIIEGGVEVIVKVEDRDVVVDSMFAGDYFGEMSLLTDSPRTATIRALTACHAFRITRSAVKQLIASDENILSLLSNNLAERNLNRTQKVQAAKNDLANKQLKSLAAKFLNLMKAVLT